MSNFPNLPGTKVIHWLPLGAIQYKKVCTSTKQQNLPNNMMTNGVVYRALVYVKNNIVQNNLFVHCNAVLYGTVPNCNYWLH